MREETKIADQSGVDKGLVAMFLRMSPEERLRANDDAFLTILRLGDAYPAIGFADPEPGRKLRTHCQDPESSRAKSVHVSSEL